MKRSVRILAREKTDLTVHRTVSYRIYGANFQKYGKNRSYHTVPYYRTTYRTPYCNSPAYFRAIGKERQYCVGEHEGSRNWQRIAWHEDVTLYQLAFPWKCTSLQK
jgi:hypothetical protein